MIHEMLLVVNRWSIDSLFRIKLKSLWLDTTGSSMARTVNPGSGYCLRIVSWQLKAMGEMRPTGIAYSPGSGRKTRFLDIFP